MKQISVEDRDHHVILYDLDSTKPLSETVNQLCVKFNISAPEQHSLLCEDVLSLDKHLVYLNDTNLKSINFEKLYLDFEPSRMLEELLQQAGPTPNDLAVLTKLLCLIFDPGFSNVFIQFGAFNWVISAYTTAISEPVKIALMAVLEHVTNQFVIPSDDITDDFLNSIFVYYESTNPNIKHLCQIYRLLSYCIANYPDMYEVTLETIQLGDLINALICENIELQASILMLINTVFEHTPDEHKANLAQVIIERNELRIVIFKYVIKPQDKLSADVAAEIFRLQNMLLYNEIKGYGSPVSMDESKLGEFKQIIHAYDPEDNTCAILRNLGFKTLPSIMEELNSLENSLVINLLTYYATKNAGAAYYPERGPSILELVSAAAIAFTRQVKNFSSSRVPGVYLPVLFEKPNMFQEIICRLIKNHKSVLPDYDTCENSEILTHFSEKLKRSISKTSFDFKNYVIELEKLDRETLTQIMNDEALQRSERLKKLAPIVRLREFYAPQAEELIRRQAFIRLAEGVSAEVLLAIKSKKSLKEDPTLFKLSAAFNAFEYTSDDQLMTVNIAGIAKMLYGDAASAKVDEKVLKKIPITSLVLVETKAGEKHVLSIDSEHHRLISDVMSMVEGQKVDDKWEPKFFSDLLDTIIDVSLMDLNENDIPIEPPPIPDPPSNFNFSCAD